MLPPTTTTTLSTTDSSSFQSTISQSVTNLLAHLSRARSWPTLTCPHSFSDAFTRLKTNSKHFCIDFGLIISFSTTLLLVRVASPFKALIWVAVIAAWLLFHVFREGVLVLHGIEFKDRMVFLLLVSLTLNVVARLGIRETVIVMIGVLVGVMICAGIGVCSDTDGLFLDEDDAVENGFIASGSRPTGP